MQRLFDGLKTPCYVIDENRLLDNLRILKSVSDSTGCKILLAQKAFSCYGVYDMISEYLAGATSSGLYEARLCHKYMPGGENHIYSPAFREEELGEIFKICNHIVFNSLRQLELYGKRAKDAGLSVGLRINPERSTQRGHAIYDPCAPGSRLGVTKDELKEGFLRSPRLFELLDGLHFHTLCEQNSDDLELTLDAVEDRFSFLLPKMKWLNLGGGHHITREDYDIPRLAGLIERLKSVYGLAVYLEPGEAVALNAGYLVTTVLEAQRRDKPVLILDASAACHMPDVLEMPYRPPIYGSGLPGEKSYSYILGCPTCLAGDVIGEYSFDSELKEGDRLVLQDMAIYSMVKNNTFNGMPLPSIYLMRDGVCRLWKSFSYQDFEARL